MLVSIKRWVLGSKTRKCPIRSDYYTRILYYAVLYYTAIQLISKLSHHLVTTRVRCRPPTIHTPCHVGVRNVEHDTPPPNYDAPSVLHRDIRAVTSPNDPQSSQESFISRHLSELATQVSELSRRIFEISRRESTPTQPDVVDGTACNVGGRVGERVYNPRNDSADSVDAAIPIAPNYVTSGTQFIQEMATQLRNLDATTDAALLQASVLNASSAKQSAIVVDNSRLILSHANSQHESRIAATNATALAYVNRNAIPFNTGLFEDMAISIPLGVIFGPT